MSHTLSILVLTEDSSPSAHATLAKLASKMLRLVEQHTQTQRVCFEPADQVMRLGVRANLWKSWKSPHPRDQRAMRLLRRTLATKVLEDDVPGFVLFHFDGDCPWSEESASENALKFKAFREGLRATVEETMQQLELPCDQAAVTDRLRRICPVTPFYSIEAWLYQATHRARELCTHGCGKHLDLISEWETDRTVLDELIKPKKQLSCIGGRKNAELAESLTHELADQLYLLEKSFHATVERLQSCPGLADALRATWYPTPPSPA